MKKEDVVWHEEDEYLVMKDSDGWQLICIMNHFKNKFWYEIKTPNNHYLKYTFENIYEAIDKLNKEKQNNRKEV